MSKYLTAVKYGIISGLINLVVCAVVFSLMSGIYAWTQNPDIIVDGKKMPRPTSDNWGEISAFLISYLLMSTNAVIMGAVAVRRIIKTDIDLVNTLVVSAIVGMVSYFIASPMNNLYLYVKSVYWHMNDYGLESAMSHSGWVMDGYIQSLPGMIIMGAIFSVIGGFLYLFYTRVKNRSQKA